MDKEIKQKWVKALRSKKYKQGMNFLYNKKQKTYCCLGVLCKVLKKNPTKVARSAGEHFLSQRILNLTGLSREDQYILSDMNDGGYVNGKLITKRNFNQIANWIEKNL